MKALLMPRSLDRPGDIPVSVFRSLPRWIPGLVVLDAELPHGLPEHARQRPYRPDPVNPKDTLIVA
jgi:hypothetical protein